MVDEVDVRVMCGMAAPMSMERERKRLTRPATSPSLWLGDVHDRAYNAVPGSLPQAQDPHQRRGKTIGHLLRRDGIDPTRLITRQGIVMPARSVHAADAPHSDHTAEMDTAHLLDSTVLVA